MVEAKDQSAAEEIKKPEALQAAPGEEEIQLTKLDVKLKFSLEERQKYQVIFDSTGECEVFFRYKAHMVELHKLQLAITMGKLTRDEAIETMRKALVYCMRIGDRLVLNCGKYNLNFVSEWTDPVNFPTQLIFDFDEWRKDEVYKRIVRPEEDHDLLGNKKCYFMNENFDLIILRDITADTKDADKREEFKNSLPHYLKSFETYFVSRQGPKDLPKPQVVKDLTHFTTGMQVITFGKNNNVTHTYHSMDYADIYDPNRKGRFGCQPQPQQPNKFGYDPYANSKWGNNQYR